MQRSLREVARTSDTCIRYNVYCKSDVDICLKGANYPSSPSCKRCEQGGAYPTGICSVEMKMLSSLPGEYGRKAET